MHIVDRQIPHICPHMYCTKSEHGFLQSGDLVIDGLYLLQRQIGHGPVEKPLLGYLDEALVGDNEDAEMPANPAGREKSAGPVNSRRADHQRRN